MFSSILPRTKQNVTLRSVEMVSSGSRSARLRVMLIDPDGNIHWSMLDLHKRGDMWEWSVQAQHVIQLALVGGAE